jgi:protein O-GlcNAc transferase
MPLEGLSADEWVMFDQVLIVRDLFTGGNRSFTDSSSAKEFRAAVYQHHGEPEGGKASTEDGRGGSSPLHR